MHDITYIEQDKELDSLLEDMAQPTQEVAEPAAPPEPPPVVEEPEEPVEKPASLAAQKFGAKFCLSLINSATELPLAFAAERKLKRKVKAVGGENAEVLYNSAVERYNVVKDVKDFTTEEQSLINIHLKVEKYLNALPYSKEEKEELMEPLMEMIKDNNFQIPAWLVITGTIIINTTQRIIKLSDI